MNKVLYTTWNPYGSNIIKIHLVPAKYNPRRADPSLVILNGNEVVPINLAWTILLAIFIKNVNQAQGRAITEKDMVKIVTNAVNEALTIYRKPGRIELKQDLFKILNTLEAIAEGKTPQENVELISLGQYADKMNAPHRMDLMVSAVKRAGRWKSTQKCYATPKEINEELKELTTEEWKKVIDICRKEYIPQLTFTGGEPTRRNDLIELIDYSQWFITRLNTNGVELTQEYCEKLKNAGLDSIQITLYSNVEDIHNRLSGADVFNKTVKGIKNAIEADLNVTVNTPICELNKDYAETVKFLDEIGVKNVTCSALIIPEKDVKPRINEIELSKDAMFETLEMARYYTSRHSMTIKFTSPGWIHRDKMEDLGIEYPTCESCLYSMAIDSDGEVLPCQGARNMRLGNILKTPWNKIWENSNCKKYRKHASKETERCPLKVGGID